MRVTLFKGSPFSKSATCPLWKLRLRVAPPTTTSLWAETTVPSVSYFDILHHIEKKEQWSVDPRAHLLVCCIGKSNFPAFISTRSCSSTFPINLKRWQLCKWSIMSSLHSSNLLIANGEPRRSPQLRERIFRIHCNLVDYINDVILTGRW